MYDNQQIMILSLYIAYIQIKGNDSLFLLDQSSRKITVNQMVLLQPQPAREATNSKGSIDESI